MSFMFFIDWYENSQKIVVISLGFHKTEQNFHMLLATLQEK